MAVLIAPPSLESTECAVNSSPNSTTHASDDTTAGAFLIPRGATQRMVIVTIFEAMVIVGVALVAAGCLVVWLSKHNVKGSQ